MAGLGRSSAAIHFKSPDGQPIRIFFVLFAPENAHGEQLQALAHVSRLFERRNLCHRLLNAKDSAEIYELLTAEDPR
jgi:nitrogen PTS system EIIA component